MTFVMDASVALACCFADEQTDEARAIARAAADRTPVAPALWPYEVSNALWVAVRRKRINEKEAVQCLHRLRGLGTRIETTPSLSDMER